MKSLRRSPFPALGLLVALAALGVASLAPDAEAASFSMNASDAFGASSFNSGLNWSPATGAPSSGNDYFAGGFTLRTPSAGGNYTFGGDSLTLNGGALQYATSGSRTITVNNLIVTANSNLGQGVNSTTMTLAGNLTLTAGVLQFDAPSGRTFLINAPIGGSGSLRLINVGTVRLASGSNTFTGGVDLNAGTLQLDNFAAVQNSPLNTSTGTGVVSLQAGSGAYTIGGLSGSTNLSSVITTNLANMTTLVLNPQSGSQSYSGNIANGAMNLTKNGTGTQILSGALSYTGATTVNAGTLQIGSGGTTGSMTGTSGITNNGTLMINRSNAFAQATDLANRAITGTGAFTQAGSGTTTLTQANTYTGITTISGGTLALSGTGSIADSSQIVIGSGGTLSITGLAGSFSLGANQTLSGTGTLLATGKTILASGTLSPGNSPGTVVQDDGVLQLAADANYNWQVYDASGVAGTGYDTTSLINGATLDLSLLSSSDRYNINLWSLSAIGPDVNGNAINFDNTDPYEWTLFSQDSAISGFSADKFQINVGAINGTSGFANSLGGGTFTVSLGGVNNNQSIMLNFVPVPEPSTLALLAAVGGLVGVRLGAARRRRHA
jgi:autotransporter-associated beta strand protein